MVSVVDSLRFGAFDWLELQLVVVVSEMNSVFLTMTETDLMRQGLKAGKSMKIRILIKLIFYGTLYQRSLAKL